MLRIIPTAVHSLEDVEYTLNAFSEVRDKLVAGKYQADSIAPVGGN
jgi:glycine C-acetyltransferase